MNIEQERNSMLADLNEVQLDLAVNGDNETSEKVRGVKQRLLQMEFNGLPEGSENLIIGGYRRDAICQCDRVLEILKKIVHGDPVTDNELFFVGMAADQLSYRINVYFATKVAAECPGIMEA